MSMTIYESFFKDVLSDEGQCVLSFVSDFRKENGDYALNNIVFNGRDDLIAALECEQVVRNRDLWFDTSTYLSNTVSKYIGRRDVNVHQVKSLWVDLDVGEGKPYSNSDAAIVDVWKITTTFGFSNPWIINSGYGIHAYWPFSSALDKDSWKKIALNFARIIAHINVGADFKIIYKVTQLMRVPFTLNCKRGNYAPTGILAVGGTPYTASKYDALINNFITDNNVMDKSIAAPPKSAAFSLNALPPSKLTGGIPDMHLPKNADVIIRKCKQIRESPYESEPIWRAMLTVIRLCENGEQKAHELSAECGDKYDYSATENKLQYMRNTHPVGGMPACCSEFNLLRPGVCDQCPSFNTIKSPIVLGRGEPVVNIPPAQVVEITSAEKKSEFVVPSEILSTPITACEFNNHQFFINADGTFFISSAKDDMGMPVRKNILLTPLRIYPTSVIHTKDDSGQYTLSHMWRCVSPDNKIREAIVPASKIMTETGLLQLFGHYFGLVIMNRGLWEPMNVYLRTILSASADQGKLIQTFPKPHFGWNDDGEFVLGNETFAPGTAAVSTATLESGLKTFGVDKIICAGTIDGWKKSASVFNHPDMQWAQMVVGASFGAPLAILTEAKGFILSVFGNSGAGKSTAQSIGNAVWGHPHRLTNKSPGTKLGDTIRSVEHAIGMMHSLPISLDELTLMEPPELVGLVYNLSQGRTKTRLQGSKDNAGYSVSTPYEWHTIFTASSNKALKDVVAEGANTTDVLAALNYRIFEVGPVQVSEAARNSENLDLVRFNYGMVGREYIRTIIANMDKVHEAKARIDERLTLRLKPTQSERFLIAGISCIYLGLYLAKKFGYVDYDMATFEDYLVMEYGQQRNLLKDLKEADHALFTDMLIHLLPSTLVVDSNMLSGFNKTRVVKDVRFDQVSSRLDVTSLKFSVTASKLKEFAKLRNRSYREILRTAIDQGYMLKAESSRIHLGAGVDGYSHLARVSCYDFVLPSTLVDNLKATADIPHSGE